MRAVGILLCLFTVLAVAAALRRGPWLDEFWTLWFAQHDLPLLELARQRWRVDFNPPLFSTLHWLLGLVGGDSLIGHRLFNLLPLAWAVAFGSVLLRWRPARATFVLVFAVLLFAWPASIDYFAEARSYFAQICLFFVLVAGGFALVDDADDLDWQRDRVPASMFLATVVLATNLHYIATLQALILLGPLTLLCLWRGQRRWATALLCALAAALLLLALYLAYHLQFLIPASKTYWVTSSVGKALLIFARAVWQCLAAAPLASALAGCALLLTLAARVHVRGLAGEAPIFERGFAEALRAPEARVPRLLLVIAAAAAFAAILLVTHVVRPLVTERYIVSFQVLIVGTIAALSANAIMSRRLLWSLLLVMALPAVLLHAYRAQQPQLWDASARLVRERVAACPGSVVHALVPAPASQPEAEVEVRYWAHAERARRLGFAVQPMAAGDSRAPTTADPCPTLLWVEHVRIKERPNGATAATMLERLQLDAGAVDLARAQVLAGETGYVLVLPARPASAPRTGP
ncbi:hypothetical protein [Rivibacter subsaxonicus]|nr:hypothetical protein [Rivibacter subsaxonicus]